MKNKIVIFGAGEWGKIAYYYYRESYEIVCYIDNDKTIWDTYVNGIKVCSPEILKEQKYTVVVANKRHEEKIKQQLLNDYDIRGVILFRIEEKMQELFQENAACPSAEEVIIAFCCGLGNQMFQYALYKNLLKQGKNVKADLSAYIKPDMMRFQLCDIFSKVNVERCCPSKKEKYIKMGKDKVYIEEPPKGKERMIFQQKLLEMESGYIEGWHCSYKYPEQIRQELLEDFAFSYQEDETLCKWKTILEQKEIVGVHVRRGDFLSPQYRRLIGNICTKEYYNQAISYVKDKYPNAVFCFFSDDIEWVKCNMREENALYIEKDMFTRYYDWYDMFLMSRCKHNIIPNSTFGWWGAWLNQNPDKLVIAPKKWKNGWEAEDWCPPEWVLM